MPEPIEGMVWCSYEGTVHADTPDPYDYGPQEPQNVDLESDEWSIENGPGWPGGLAHYTCPGDHKPLYTEPPKGGPKLNISQGRILEKLIGEEFDRLAHETFQHFEDEKQRRVNEAVVKIAELEGRFHKRMTTLIEAMEKAMPEDIELTPYWRDPTPFKVNDSLFGNQAYYKALGSIKAARDQWIRYIRMAQLTDTDASDILERLPTLGEIISGNIKTPG